MPRALPLARIAVLASLGLAAVAAVPSGAATGTASFGQGDAAFVVSAAPSSLSAADAAGEPSLGVSWKSGNALFQSLMDTYKLRFDNRAQPPTVTWSDVSSPYSFVNVDPILATDPATGVTLAGGDDGACAVLSRTQDDGESWAPSIPCTGVVDHPSVGLGPFAGAAPAGASGPVAAYFCQQYPILNQCSRSLDGGSTWSPGVTVKGCAGVFGHIKVAPNGHVYVPSGECFSGGLPFVGDTNVGGFVSRDNGLTWDSWAVPGAKWPDRGFDPSVGITTDGTIYEGWGADLNAHPMIAVSHDDAAHWSKPVDLAATVDPPIAGATFATVVAGSPGRAAFAFLGTRHQPANGVSVYDDKDALWHLYVSMTYDGGATWTTTQVTTDPVQRGGISDGGVAGDETRNLLDFMDAGVTRDGRVVVGFADGCIESTHCTLDEATPSTSRSSWATVAYQAYGRGLLAQYDS
ncbi:MAG: hypothetical protein QOE05_3344 [Actinomycetota bacterium]|jgi:hypothetical protein|nr:hypothetical protein [Actinomycetota bacterium]